MIIYLSVFFFFSSRRRHTRWTGDWSSDVCSSDLLTRRHRYTGKLSFYRCWTPGPVPLSRLITIAVTRWRIEEDHQLAKQSTGLDAGQVIRWKSWHRRTAICLLAYIYLAVTVAVQRQQEAGQDLDAGLI